jgi:hypothetical protein
MTAEPEPQKKLRPFDGVGDMDFFLLRKFASSIFLSGGGIA